MPLLVLSVQEPEVGLKRVCASALSDISKHSQELAHTVAAEGAVPHLSKMLTHRDAKLKRQVGACLSNIAKHNVDLAEAVVESRAIPRCVASSGPRLFVACRDSRMAAVPTHAGCCPASRTTTCSSASTPPSPSATS